MLSILRTLDSKEREGLTVANETIGIKTSANDEIVDITHKVQEAVARSKIQDGLACVFVVGSTAAVASGSSPWAWRE